MKKDDAMNTSFTAKPRRRLSAGKSKLPASLTPQMQSLNRTQQILSAHQQLSASKKQSLPATLELPNTQQVIEDELKEQPQNPILTNEDQEGEDHINDEEDLSQQENNEQEIIMEEAAQEHEEEEEDEVQIVPVIEKLSPKSEQMMVVQQEQVTESQEIVPQTEEPSQVIHEVKAEEIKVEVPNNSVENVKNYLAP